MAEMYTTATWIPKPGEEAAFIEAGAVQQHVNAFAPSELEIVAEVSHPAG